MLASSLLFAWIAGAALIAFVAAFCFFTRQTLPWRKFPVGAPIVYRVTETSTSPRPDVHQVQPAEKGEFYYFVTHKYWRVEEVLPDGWIVARSRLMEQHLLRRDDPNLRKANLLERLRHGDRFPYFA
jgi:hypothetical protein